MSKLKIKYNRSSGLFEFTEESISPTYCDVVACLDTAGETLEFSNLSYGLIIKNGETILGQKTFPEPGVKIIKSDQPYLRSYRVLWDADMVIDVEVWMEQTPGKVEGSYQLTVPKPSKPSESHIWDEETLSWIEPE
jgi:hypothetical protein